MRIFIPTHDFEAAKLLAIALSETTKYTAVMGSPRPKVYGVYLSLEIEGALQPSDPARDPADTPVEGE